MLPLRHQSWRYLFQALWLLVFAVLIVSGAGLAVWVGLLCAALVSALILKRAACSFACPLFTVGEMLWRTGNNLFGRTFVPPLWFDLLLRSTKYLLVAGIVWGYFGGDAWGHFFPRSVPVMPVIALLILSLFFQMPWCRYLCPAGALLGLLSTASLGKIRRAPRHCVRCHRCDSHCPANQPVMLRTAVRSPECFACYRCVDGCPAPRALAFAMPGRRGVPAWLTGFLLSLFLLTGLGLALLI